MSSVNNNRPALNLNSQANLTKANTSNTNKADNNLSIPDLNSLTKTINDEIQLNLPDLNSLLGNTSPEQMQDISKLFKSLISTLQFRIKNQSGGRASEQRPSPSKQYTNFTPPKSIIDMNGPKFQIPLRPSPPVMPKPIEPPKPPPYPQPPPYPMAVKPAVYLYPERIIEVQVFIDPEVDLTIDIPTYKVDKGWKVLAHPNGLLEDLQLELTDPNSYKKYLDSVGLEYAYSSALRGIYPYLYWEGIKKEALERRNIGWIVNAENIETFLNEKLDEMKFNRVEKKDFLDYWIIKINEKQKPFYWISFLLTEDYDQKHPMKIIPKPDSIFRLFIEVASLDNKPLELPKAQKLDSISRQGFTVLEWGGHFL